MKNMYLIEREKTGDAWNEGIFTNKAKAIKKARFMWDILSKYDQEHSRIAVYRGTDFSDENEDRFSEPIFTLQGKWYERQ